MFSNIGESTIVFIPRFSNLGGGTETIEYWHLRALKNTLDDLAGDIEDKFIARAIDDSHILAGAISIVSD